MYNKEAIRNALTPNEYLEKLGHELKARHSGFSGACPICGGDEHSTRFSITDDLWHCFSCNAGGDVFTLHAKLNKISSGQAIKDLGAKLGMRGDEKAPSLTDQLTAFLERHKKKEDKVRESEVAAIEAKRLFETLPPLTPDGYTYLLSRGVEGSYCPNLRDDGSRVYLPLLDFTGGIINLVGRSYRDEEPRLKQLAHGNVCGTFGSFTTHVTGKPFLIVEGLMDYLTALRCSLPNQYTVLGVHSCSNIPKVCVFLANAIRNSSVTFVQHNDSAGIEATEKGAVSLINMGVQREKVGISHIPTEYNDFNDVIVGVGAEEATRLLGLT